MRGPLGRLAALSPANSGSSLWVVTSGGHPQEVPGAGGDGAPRQAPRRERLRTLRGDHGRLSRSHGPQA